MSASSTTATALKLLIPIDDVIPVASADSAPMLTNAFKIIQPRIVFELPGNEAITSTRDLSGEQRAPGVASEIARTVPKEQHGSEFLAITTQTGQTEQVKRQKNF